NQKNEERDPSQALLLLAQLAEERQDTDAALKWLDRIEPGEAYLGAQLKRAQLLARRGDMAGARKVLQQAAVDSEADKVQLIVAEAQLLRDANRTQEAFAVLDAGLKSHPDNTDILYDYGMLAEKSNKLDLMEKTFRKVIALAPKNQHAYNALGYSLAERKLRLPEALTLITKANELAPQDPYIMDSLGWVYYRLGNLKEAEIYLRRAYALRPEAEIGAHLGEVLWIKGAKEEAQKYWREAQSKDPKNDTLKSTLLRLQGRL
ncbi:MAG: tetratricopeptide repeat protein, partial [Proteobacteria bacterium]|nr:tetratricopeptide repeat protein [Pseudomonadota bacterium]